MENSTVPSVVTNIMLAWALALAEIGWLVFPLHEPIGIDLCSCMNPECRNVGKHPRVSNGFHSATKDPAVITGWWTQWPNASIGIRTGPESGIAVLDLDAGKGGYESLEKLEAEFGALPVTVEAITGGGGRHIIFRYPTNGTAIKNRTEFLAGLDVRGDGGYIVGVPSRHRNGSFYAWDAGCAPQQRALAELPAWLGEQMTKIKTSPSAVGQVASTLGSTISKGKRHPTLVSLAGTMARRGMGQVSIEAALFEENIAKCDPPLPEEEIVKIALWAAAKPQGADSADAASPVIEVPAELPFHTAAEVSAEHTIINWIIEGFATEGSVTEFTGKAKQGGKTTFLLAGIRRILDGAEFLGHPTQKCSVVYLTEERPKTFNQALKRADLLGRADLHILYWSDAANTPWPSIVRAAVKKASEVEAKMIVIDTVSQWAGFKGEEENSAGAAMEALRPVQEASATGLAVIVVRHERKSGGVVGEAARGSSAFAGAADIVISIRRPEGNTKPTLRTLQTLSRFDKVPPDLVELTDHGYVIVGGDTTDLAVEGIRNMLSNSGAALTVDEMMEASGLKRTTVQDAIKRLVNDKLAVRLAGGVKGTPFRYASANNAAGTSTPVAAAPAASVPEAVAQFAAQASSGAGSMPVSSSTSPTK